MSTGTGTVAFHSRLPIDRGRVVESPSVSSTRSNFCRCFGKASKGVTGTMGIREWVVGGSGGCGHLVICRYLVSLSCERRAQNILYYVERKGN